MPRPKRPTRGFTLVEAIATMVVLAVVSMASSGVIWAAVRSFDEGAETARVHNEASIAMERMVRELRAIPLNGAGTPDIASVTGQSITWDGGTRSLALSGSDLILTASSVDHVLLTHVTEFTVQAYDASNTALGASLNGADCEPIRRLSLQVAVSDGRASSVIRTKVFLRCMMLEEMQ